jgi:hypothetical protein
VIVTERTTNGAAAGERNDAKRKNDLKDGRVYLRVCFDNEKSENFEKAQVPYPGSR